MVRSNGSGINCSQLFLPVIDDETERIFTSLPPPKVSSFWNTPIIEYVYVSTGVDDVVKKLVELALNNTNENEAKNAAFTVCKKIQKLTRGK